jgi:hypothetical protein
MAIPSVYVCEILCDLDIYSMKRTCRDAICSTTDSHDLNHLATTVSDHNHHLSNVKHSHDSNVEHSHDSNVEHSHDTPALHDNISLHDTEQEDDCCDDMTSSIFETLISQKLELSSLDAKLFLIFDVAIPSYYVSSNTILTDPFKFYTDPSPPLPGSDIFILVQSFLL